jgi:hypothetical protein
MDGSVWLLGLVFAYAGVEIARDCAALRTLWLLVCVCHVVAVVRTVVGVFLNWVLLLLLVVA